MAMDFPNSPVVGQIFSSGSRQWVWTGTTWDSPAAGTPGIVSSTGGTFTGDITAPNYAGRGNAVINGAFEVNQRNITTANTTDVFIFDRWKTEFFTLSATYSSQAFSPGTAPVSGVEGTNFLRVVTSSATGGYCSATYNVEDVRTLAGQTATLSFWAKSSTAGAKIAVRVAQLFGTGGSSIVGVNGSTVPTLTSSWARYSFNLNIPSLSGKTIGANNHLRLYLLTSDVVSGTGVGNQNATIDIWGVQLEAGTVATPFKRNANSLQGELAACQRYYYRVSDVAGASGLWPLGTTESSTTLTSANQNPVPLRTAPTSVEFSNLRTWDGGSVHPVTNVTLGGSNANFTGLTFTVASGLTQFRAARVLVSASLAGFIGISAEL